MPARRTLRLMMIVAGVWLAGVAPTRAQSPNCSVWEENHPALAPSPRHGHAMAYDSARQVTVMFSGTETWEWDGVTWSQRNTVGPAARSHAAMAYDELRGVTVLFGGEFNGFFGDTWEWDGVHWTLRSNIGPPPRFGHAMAYDSDRGVTVLFGGRNPALDLLRLADTWEWDGTSWLLKSLVGPAPRYEHAMAYDSRRGVTVLYGGYGGAGQTWEWDGCVWVRRNGVGPELRIAHTMAYDSTRGVTLLFSGFGPGRPNSQTWAWDGTMWTLLSEIGPPARLYAGMAYESNRSVAVLFGGGYPLGQTVDFNDTWELPSCPGDPDGDGVNDPDDACPNSDLAASVVIDGCDTGVGNQLFDDGCTMADRIAECADEAGNHGNFVSCVSRLAHDWGEAGIITLRNKGPIQRCAAQADLPEQCENNTRPTKGAQISPVEALSRP